MTRSKKKVKFLIKDVFLKNLERNNNRFLSKNLILLPLMLNKVIFVYNGLNMVKYKIKTLEVMGLKVGRYIFTRRFANHRRN